MTTADQEHFKGKSANQHVLEAQEKGLTNAAESHGTEVPGHIAAGADAARETALILLVLWTTLSRFGVSEERLFTSFAIFGVTWIFWRIGRSAWLGWSRLERLHRVVEEESWEIQHHRDQEREELAVLYGAKGFEGQLLEDILDVLMSDNERLLQVMLEEEMGFKLEVHEHPLKQGLGAGVGAALALLVCALSIFTIPLYGIVVAACSVMGAAAVVSARYEKNQMVTALVWNVGLGVVAFGIASFLLEFFIK